jgi:hypothetical protein
LPGCGATGVSRPMSRGSLLVGVKYEFQCMYVYRSPVTPGYRKTVETGLVKGNVKR